MNKNIIEIKNLRKSYKDIEVLKGVDLEVEKGGIFALLGANGAGKTTMIRIMATLLKSDSGSVEINSFNVDKRPLDVKKSISLTGQFAAVDEVLTARENLIMIAKLRRIKNPKLAADNLLNRFGLSKSADRKVGTFSGGMKRRIDIAMSLLGKPKIIFLDEPTTGLDPEGRIEVWNIIKELRDSGTTIFLTTQYLDEAEHLANKIAILYEGRIIVKGTMDDLRALIPPVKVEFIEKKPTLEEIFLAVTSKRGIVNDKLV